MKWLPPRQLISFDAATSIFTLSVFSDSTVNAAFGDVRAAFSLSDAAQSAVLTYEELSDSLTIELSPISIASTEESQSEPSYSPSYPHSKEEATTGTKVSNEIEISNEISISTEMYGTDQCRAASSLNSTVATNNDKAAELDPMSHSKPALPFNLASFFFSLAAVSNSFPAIRNRIELFWPLKFE